MDDSRPPAGPGALRQDLSQRPQSRLPPNWAERTLDCLATPLCLRDSASRFAWANERYILAFGGGREGLCGLSLEQVFPPAQAQAERTADLEALARHARQQLEEEGVRLEMESTGPLCAAGQRTVVPQAETGVWLLCGAPLAPQPPERGPSWPERVRALERHRRLAADCVVAGLAHDIRNPLGAICNALAVLQRRLRDHSDEDTASALRLAHREAWHLERMVAATIERTAGTVPQLRNVSIAEVATAAWAWRGGSLRTALNEAQLAQTAHADPEQVGAAIDLVLSCCLLSVPPGTVPSGITLRSGPRSDSEFVELTIEAPGPADAQDFAREREIGTRQANPHADEALPMAEKLLESQGGALRYQRHAGGSAVFTLRLPRTTQEAKPASG